MQDRQRFLKFRFTVALFGKVLRLCQQVAVFIQAACQVDGGAAHPFGQLQHADLFGQMLFQRFVAADVEYGIIGLFQSGQFHLLVKIAQAFLKVVGFQPLGFAGAHIFIGVAGQIFLQFDYRIFQHRLIQVLVQMQSIHF